MNNLDYQTDVDDQSHDFSSPVPASCSFPDENPNTSFVKDVALPLPALTGPDCIDQNSTSERTLLLPPPPGKADQLSQLTLAFNSGELALQRLIGVAIPQGELVSLVETIFSSREVTDTVGHLQESNAQDFIDVVNEVRYNPPASRKSVE